jgi:RNA polymerase sigma factor (sigma-70 family)
VANRFGALNLSGARAERRRHVRATWRRLTQQFGRNATAAEVAVALGQHPDGVAELLELEPPCALVDEAGYIIDPPDSKAAAAFDQVVETRLPLADWVRRLPALQRRVVELRFGFGREPASYQGIGAQLGMSASTVRRIERRALDQLRDSCSTDDYAMAG